MECCLSRGELTRVGSRRGMQLRCLSGTLWVTVGDGADYLVSQGSSFKVAAGASALVEALGSAEMKVEAEDGEATSIGAVPAAHSFRVLHG